VLQTIFFNELDEKTQGILAQARENVGLYRATPFYASNRPSLGAHVRHNLQKFLEMPSVQKIVLHGPGTPSYEFMCTFCRMFLSHDNGEMFGEAQSFQQKALGPDMKALVREFEFRVSRYSYSIATRHAIKNKSTECLVLFSELQKNFQDRLEALALEPDNIKAYEGALEEVLDRLETIDTNMSFMLSAEELKQADANTDRHMMYYSMCELPSMQLVNTAACGAKLWDKNCDLYTLNAEKKYADPTMDSLALCREPNKLAIKTIRRAEAYLGQFLELAEKDDIKLDPQLTKEIRDHVLDHLATYARLGRPFILLSDALALPDEPLPEADTEIHALYKMNLDDVVQQRRYKIHPLRDTDILSQQELEAKIFLIKGLDLRQESVLSADMDLMQFRGEYDWILDGIKNRKFDPVSYQRRLFP